MKRSVHKIQLPEKFAETLLDKEIDYVLAKDPSQEMVRDLVQLYSIGVEYYESIKSYKYLYFQKKMAEIFNSKTVIKNFTKAQTKIDSPLKKQMQSTCEEEKLAAYKVQEQQQRMRKEISSKANKQAASSQARKIISDTDEKLNKFKARIDSQILDQKEQLEEKIRMRKEKSIKAKSFSSIDLMDFGDTRESLFDIPGQKNPCKPIPAHFGDLIEESSSQQEETEWRKRKNSKHVDLLEVMFEEIEPRERRASRLSRTFSNKDLHDG